MCAIANFAILKGYLCRNFDEMFTELFTDYSFATIAMIVVLCLIAGLIDAIVGGGGLVTVPMLLISFPTTALPTLLGTNKIGSLSGTSVAAYQYWKIKFDFVLLFVVGIFAAASSFLGARIVSDIDANLLKPIILIVLIFIAIYTYRKKDFGSNQTKVLALRKKIVFGIFLGIVIGFYDGFFGPGTGSFLIMGFVWLLGFDFLSASAYAKFINCATNIAALFVFIRNGDYLPQIAILMATCLIIGNFLGSKLAMNRGSGFVRKIFLFVVIMMIIRYGYDIATLFIQSN